MKKSIESLDIFDLLMKEHVADLLVARGPLSFRQLRLCVIESFPVGALMPTLQEMLSDGKVQFDKDGFLNVCSENKS